MNPKLNEFIKNNYADYKSDFSAFGHSCFTNDKNRVVTVALLLMYGCLFRVRKNAELLV